MKCQTSPQYPLYRYGDPEKHLTINFGGDGGFLYRLSSKLLFWTDDAACCAALDMSLIDNDRLSVMGSYSILWPLFLTLCFSQFVETLICALQGRQPMAETGMTTFEHSLAFAECEAMISNALGLGFFSSSKSESASGSARADTSASSGPLLTKSMVLRRLNVPSEVLLIAFISCLSHLSSALLAVSGQRNRLRLINTGIWAFCYMGAFAWSLARVLSEPIDDDDDLGILRFPTVCIIGFIPHILILVGISMCGIIYGTALFVTALSLPAGADSNPPLKERFRIAFHNLQANVQFSSSSAIKLNWHEDFYTTLLKIGFNVLTAASEAVYLNEGSRIRIHEMTWLEEKRIEELATYRRRLGAVPPELMDERIARGLQSTDHRNLPSQSGYAQERKSKSAKDTTSTKGANTDSGLGIAERRGRWQLTVEFLKGIYLLLVQTLAGLLISLLDRFGSVRISGWLRRLTRRDGPAKSTTVSRREQTAERPSFWLVGDDGRISIAEDGNVDVEKEMRRRLRSANAGSNPTEEMVDEDLYSWWKKGGWWGDLDTSGDYKEREQDDDTTSMISMSTNAPSEAGSEEEQSGRRTPTQDDFPAYSREVTPEPTLGLSDLARLLDPKSAQDREEAQMLSRRLQSERPMTRSQYRRRTHQERAQILPLANHAHSNTNLMTEAEEEEALEHFILERRAAARRKTDQGGSWDSGAEGMGSGGPQCVVCQTSPRVIMVWPCGCLSVCDDCRVGVATRNFSNCLCCRTNVVAYSRLYVP